MRKLYILCLIACVFAIHSFGQSVMDPNDTVVNYNSNTPPTQPAWGKIGKWVRTPRVSWNTNEYKCYIYKGAAFRLHFPKSYNPTANDGKKYPMLVFFHGLGEAGNIYDNEYQLYHGGNVFQAAVDNGKFDGYVLCMQSDGFWGSNQYQDIAEIIDYMVANNKLDPFAVSDNGLSAGGAGTWEMMFSHPSYIASAVPMSSISTNYTAQSVIDEVKFTPIWDIQGGQDGSPAPYTAHTVRDAMLAAGANFTYKEFTTLGHGTWDSTWLLPDFW
ncbi:MAG TPA: prolyl oligopeptidase family serine peptidase, partial [Parafilimonas sp.]|nr:prolyl oligopeptidase family serine peptidase [Parafilimonas sp.]